MKLTVSNSCGDDYSEELIDLLDLSMLENVSENLSIFPNPTKGQLRIEGEAINKIEIISANGIVVRVLEPNTQTINLSLEQEAKGIYFVRIITNNEIQTKKIVLE